MAQTIEKSGLTPPDVFDPAQDVIRETSRGAGTITRRIDFNLLPFGVPLTDFYEYSLSNVTASLGTPFEITELSSDEEGNLVITWSSHPSGTYVVQRSSDQQSWIDIATVRSQGESTTFIETGVGEHDERLFYRITQ